RRRAALSAPLQPRHEPDREGVLQAQSLLAQNRRANRRRPHAHPRSLRRYLQTRRMHKLFCGLWIRYNLIGYRSKPNQIGSAGARWKRDSMSDQACILVFGIDETASAVARMLLLSGYAVAIHQPAPPTLLRRKMAFADAWYDGASMLDGVQARRADLSSDFLIGLSNRMYIPVLTHPLAEVVERWPWDVIIDAQTPGERLRAPIKSHAEMTIALGPGPIAGVDCDLVIETFGPDPGATLRSGAARSPSRHERDKMLDDAHPAVALETGIFTTGRII